MFWESFWYPSLLATKKLEESSHLKAFRSYKPLWYFISLWNHYGQKMLLHSIRVILSPCVCPGDHRRIPFIHFGINDNWGKKIESHLDRFLSQIYCPRIIPLFLDSAVHSLFVEDVELNEIFILLFYKAWKVYQSQIVIVLWTDHTFGNQASA